MADEAIGGSDIPQYFQVELRQAEPVQKEVAMKFKFICDDDKESTNSEVVQFTLDLEKVTRISHISWAVLTNCLSVCLSV